MYIRCKLTNVILFSAPNYKRSRTVLSAPGRRREDQRRVPPTLPKLNNLTSGHLVEQNDHNQNAQFVNIPRPHYRKAPPVTQHNDRQPYGPAYAQSRRGKLSNPKVLSLSIKTAPFDFFNDG